MRKRSRSDDDTVAQFENMGFIVKGFEGNEIRSLVLYHVTSPLLAVSPFV